MISGFSVDGGRGRMSLMPRHGMEIPEFSVGDGLGVSLTGGQAKSDRRKVRPGFLVAGVPWAVRKSCVFVKG